ncbi:MAG: hypothetical protein K5770_07190 [Lachnospiraceae bacterium]|nr:hypothetical protein [Lachnospiraceae bacterium]
MENKDYNRKTSMIVGEGGYAINYGHIDVSDPKGEGGFFYSYTNVPNNPGVWVQNECLAGMAALEPNPERPNEMQFAAHATLINRGTIDIHFDEIYRYYMDKKSKTDTPEDFRFDTVRCFAMLAGEQSLLVNEGTINVYLDQDIEAIVSLYACGLWANAGSLMLNKGEINFIGNGSYQSFVRGIGSMMDDLKAVNMGTVNVKLDRAYQTRILHTAGKSGSLLNYGKINVETCGRIMVIGSLMGTRMENDGEINVISHSTYIENIVPYHYQFDPLACAFYEHFLPNEEPPAPTVNRGKIKIHLAGSEKSGENAVAFGFYLMQIAPSKTESPVHAIYNDGTVEVTQEGPVHYLTAEVGVNIQAPGNNEFNVKIGSWNTNKRDFTSSKDLFVCRSASFDLSGLPDYIDKNECVYQIPASKEAGEKVTIKDF